MDNIFMNCANVKLSDPRRLLVNSSDKINLKRKDKYVALSNPSIHYTWKNIKKSHKIKEFKTSAPTWSKEFELPDGSYSVLDIQNFFQYIIKRHETVTVNPSITIYVNKTENRITFKMKPGYYLERLTPKKIKLLGSTKSKITENKNRENAPYLVITKVVLVHFNMVDNDRQYYSRVLSTLFLINHFVKY